MIQKRLINHKFATTILLLILIVSFFPVSVTATITTSGDINPIYDGSDPWNIPGELKIGMTSDGSMTISDASAVNSLIGYVGSAEGTGTVTICDSDSLWNNSSSLYVGYEGNADMTISDGGRLADENGYAGFKIADEANVTVTGSGTVWENSYNLYIGYDGYADVVISNGGRITDVNGYIGYTAGYGSVTATGTTSLWQNSGDLYIGYNGDAELTISDGAKVTSARSFVGYGSYPVAADYYDEDTLLIRFAPKSDGSIPSTEEMNEILASLGGGTVLKKYTIVPGLTEVELSEGMVVNAKTLRTYDQSPEILYAEPNYIVYIVEDQTDINQDSTTNIRLVHVTVTGSSSLWENTGDLFLGYEGLGNMTISNGSTVTGTNAYIGYGVSSMGTATVTGQNSLWDMSDNLYIGGSATSGGGIGLLDISNEAIVEADNVTIWSTGTVSGDGILRANTITNKGTIEPGNSIGTLTIEGNLTMDTDSTLEVEIDNSGNSDKLAVTGDVDIAGGTVKTISTETITDSQEYTIVEADSVTGTFVGLDTALLHATFSNVGTELDYETDSVTLNISPVPFDDSDIVLTSNQIALGSALQQIADSGGNSITTALQSCHSINQVRGAYDQLSGQSRPSLAPISTAGTAIFSGAVSDRLHNTHGGVSYGMSRGPLLAMAGPVDSTVMEATYDVTPVRHGFALGNNTDIFTDQRWGIWGKGYGVFGDRETEGGAPGYQYTVYGTGFGLDYQCTDRLLVGVTTGYVDGSVDYSSSRDKSNVSSIPIGLYGSYDTNNWYFDCILNYARLEYTTERHVDLTAEKLSAEFDGDEIGGYFEGGFNWHYNEDCLIRPLASFQFAHLNLESYTESGGASSLGYNDQSYESHKGSLGVKLTKQLRKNTEALSSTVELRGRWIHEFGDTKSHVDAHFASDPGIIFTVNDEDISRDSVALGIGLKGKLGSRTSLAIDYDTSLNADHTSHIVSAGLEHRW